MESVTTSPDQVELNELEEKVERVARRVEELRGTNLQLEEELRRLRENLAEREQTVKDLGRRLERAGGCRDKAKEERIREKLTALLKRLEALDGGTAETS